MCKYEVYRLLKNGIWKLRWLRKKKSNIHRGPESKSIWRNTKIFLTPRTLRENLSIKKKNRKYSLPLKLSYSASILNKLTQRPRPLSLTDFCKTNEKLGWETENHKEIKDERSWCILIVDNIPTNRDAARQSITINQDYNQFKQYMLYPLNNTIHVR